MTTMDCLRSKNQFGNWQCVDAFDLVNRPIVPDSGVCSVRHLDNLSRLVVSETREPRPKRPVLGVLRLVVAFG